MRSEIKFFLQFHRDPKMEFQLHLQTLVGPLPHAAFWMPDGFTGPELRDILLWADFCAPMRNYSANYSTSTSPVCSISNWLGWLAWLVCVTCHYDLWKIVHRSRLRQSSTRRNISRRDEYFYQHSFCRKFHEGIWSGDLDRNFCLGYCPRRRYLRKTGVCGEADCHLHHRREHWSTASGP